MILYTSQIRAGKRDEEGIVGTLSDLSQLYYESNEKQPKLSHKALKSNEAENQS